MDAPAADITVDVELVRRLIAAQHPELDGELWLVASGWDNAIFRLGEQLSVRLPRRSIAAQLIEHEQHWLPEFAQRVDVPLPVPVRVGVPSDEYPWHWSICEWFSGRPAAALTASERTGLVTQLAEFISQLHTAAPADAPFNPVRGVALGTRSAAVADRLASGSIDNVEAIRARWEELVVTPAWSGEPIWLHGDLHPANVIVANDGSNAPTQLAAVIDFGDLTAGDPATDLATAWLMFDADARADFRARVTELAGAGSTGVDGNTWRRARGWALNMGTAMAAHSDDNPQLAAVGRHALGQVLLDE